MATGALDCYSAPVGSSITILPSPLGLPHFNIGRPHFNIDIGGTAENGEKRRHPCSASASRN